MQEVTLKQIAEILQISVTTVSKALKDYKDVSPKTKADVRNLAAKLNYKPNPTALSLRNRETKIIGLIIPEVVHHFFASIIHGVVLEAENHGYLVITLISNDSYELEKQQVALLLDKRVDGILVSLAGSTVHTHHISQILKKEVPLVMFDKISDEIRCSQVIIDDWNAAFEATEKLILSGCKKIIHLKGPDGPKTSQDRFDGYKDALKKHGIPFHSSYVYTSKNVSIEDGYELTKQALKDHPDIDAVFCITDLVAAGVHKYCKTHQIKMPEQISIIGFSNWLISELMSPSLSTVDQPGYEMGIRAVNLLIQEIGSKKSDEMTVLQKIVLPTKVLLRETTR
jgi:LacI family transcriptional regulator